METCIVLISVRYHNARKTCEQIENEKFDSRDIAINTIKELLNEDEVGHIPILRLIEFMEEVNDQNLDNLTEYFISYVHINLELSK
jgi:hypothetical protein